MMKAILTAVCVDDEADSLESLGILLKKTAPEVHVLHFCKSSREGIAAIRDDKPDLVFLDIQMPGMTGFEMLEHLDPPHPHVIFTTAYDHFALDAIKVSAMDYLLKPLDEEDLRNAIIKAHNRLHESDPSRQLEILLTNIKGMDSGFQKLAIPTVDELKFINISDILYCKADGNYTSVYTNDGACHTLSKSLKEISSFLHHPFFFRTHQSYLVNLNFVSKYIRGAGGQLILQDGTAVQVARTKKDELLKLIYK